MDKSAALIGALSVVALATPAFAKTETVTGQLIDVGCYAAGRPASDYTGVHARACALEGFEVGLLTSDGKVYFVKGELAANSNAKLLPGFMAKTVTITGEVSEKGGKMLIVASDLKMIK
jgi:hypothetical protein